MDPPTKLELQKLLDIEASKANLLLGMDADHMPDRKWMIIALGTLNPSHHIFSKSYKPQVTRMQAAAHH